MSHRLWDRELAVSIPSLTIHHVAGWGQLLTLINYILPFWGALFSDCWLQFHVFYVRFHTLCFKHVESLKRNSTSNGWMRPLKVELYQTLALMFFTNTSLNTCEIPSWMLSYVYKSSRHISEDNLYSLVISRNLCQSVTSFSQNSHWDIKLTSHH